MTQNHPWKHAATYIRAAFVEEIHPVAVNTAERAALLLERAANEPQENSMTTSIVSMDLEIVNVGEAAQLINEVVEAVSELENQDPALKQQLNHLTDTPDLLKQLFDIKIAPGQGEDGTLAALLKPTKLLLELPEAIRAGNIDHLLQNEERES